MQPLLFTNHITNNKHITQKTQNNPQFQIHTMTTPFMQRIVKIYKDFTLYILREG
jgi:hypothetical protein